MLLDIKVDFVVAFSAWDEHIKQREHNPTLSTIKLCKLPRTQIKIFERTPLPITSHNLSTDISLVVTYWYMVILTAFTYEYTLKNGKGTVYKHNQHESFV